MKTIRVFVSSTFADMHAERDHINRFVFPELRSRCLRRNAELVGIDLRWGITQEESRRRGALEICLDEIQRSTFFVSLLGDRYGFVPAPETIPRAVFERAGRRAGASRQDTILLRRWYRHDETTSARLFVLRRDREIPSDVARRLNQLWRAAGVPHAGDSITAREIARGAFDAGRNARKAFFYLRESGLHLHPHFPGSFVPRFLEQDPENHERLNRLKQRIGGRRGDTVVVREYKTDYAGLRIDPAYVPSELAPEDRAAFKDGRVQPGEASFLSQAARAAIDAHGTVALTGMDELGQQMLSDLWDAIECELEEHGQRGDTYSQGRSDHERFLSTRTRLFFGRERLLERMAGYTNDGSAIEPLMVTGSPGSGKSSLMAEFARRRREEFPQTLVLPYFIGAMPGSTDLTVTIRFLCEALRRECNLADELPIDPVELRMLLPAFLQRAAARRPVVLILDAINQLDPANRSHELDWIPFRLPAGVRMIVSAVPGDCLDQFRARVRGDHILQVRGLAKRDRMTLIREQLARRGKKLRRHQLARLLDTRQRPDACLPLFLLVALEELSLVGERDALDRRISTLPTTIPDLFDKVLERLEWDHTQDLVASILSWLAVSRSGLREPEIVELLGESPPRIRWTQLYRSLEFYLRPADEEAGSGLIGFYHDQLHAAVCRRYLGMHVADGVASSAARRVHEQLATYFRGLAYDGRLPAGWHTGRPRGLSELPYHLLHAGRRGQVRDLLFDFHWLQARMDSADVNALLADYEYLPGDGTSRLVQGAVQLGSHALQRDTAQLAGQLLGRLGGEKAGEIRKLLGTARRWKAASWLRPMTRSLASPRNPLVRTLAGHADAVFDLALTPDDKYVVSGSRDGTLRVWELATGRAIHVLAEHSQMVLAVAVTADGRRAISASKDRTLKIWDILQGSRLHTMAGHSDDISCIALTEDGRRVISGSRHLAFDASPNGITFKIWTLASGREVKSFFRNGAGIPLTTILAARNHYYTVVEGYGKALRVFDLMSQRLTCEIATGADHVREVAMTPDGRAIITGSDEGRLVMWDARSGREVRSFSGHRGLISAVKVTRDGRHLISGSSDRTVRVWELATGRELSVFSGHSATVSSASQTSDKRYVVTGSYDGTLKIWDAHTRSGRHTIAGHTKDVRGMVILPDGRRLVTCGEEGAIRIWNTIARRDLRTINAHEDSIFTVGASHDGRYVFTGSNDCTVKVWSTSSWKAVRTLAGTPGAISCVTMTPDGGRLVAASWGRLLTVWDFARGVRIRSLHGHAKQVNSVAVTPDGRYVISGSDDTTILVRQFNGRAVRTLRGHNGYVNCVVVTRDGRYVVSGSADKTVRIWDLRSGVALRQLLGHTGSINALAVTSDTCHVISGSDDMTVRMFDIESGKSVATFSAEGEVRACAVSDDGHTIMAGTADGRVHFLRVTAGRTPDGRRVSRRSRDRLSESIGSTCPNPRQDHSL